MAPEDTIMGVLDEPTDRISMSAGTLSERKQPTRLHRSLGLSDHPGEFLGELVLAEAYRDKYLEAGDGVEEDIAGCRYVMRLSSQEPGFPPTPYTIRIEEIDG